MITYVPKQRQRKLCNLATTLDTRSNKCFLRAKTTISNKNKDYKNNVMTRYTKMKCAIEKWKVALLDAPMSEGSSATLSIF